MNNWRDTFGASEFPALWEEILQQRFPLYAFLSESDRRELRAYIRWFLGSKEFEGCAGLVITDEIRVLVAAQACLLLLHRETPCYERLRLIRVYPGSHFATSSTEAASGESWHHGVVQLAWDSVRGGAANPFDGHNVVLHEFAHQLDEEDGKADGTPLLGRGIGPAEQAGVYAAWARTLSTEYEEFRRSIEAGGATVMDSYGGCNQVEFFAVATECFFEKPKQLCKRHPDLYAALKQFYKQDPAAWAFDPPKDANQTLEPTAAAAGSSGNSDVGAGSSSSLSVVLDDQTMSELPTLYECFEPPPEQKVVPGQSGDYVGVYLLRSWIAVETLHPPGFRFGKVERWRPVFDCDLPAELQSALDSGSSGYFAIWFDGVPSERGRYGDCTREVRVTHIARTKQGRELRANEYVR